MRHSSSVIGGLLILLAGCAPPIPPTPSPELPATLLDTANIDVGPDGRCFTSRIITPAVTQMVMEPVEVIPAQIDAGGMVTAPPVFRNQEVERVVTPAEQSRFETLCPPAFTPEFTSSLQRALIARDAYAGPVTGLYDQATGEAVRLYQNASGPNSQIIAMSTARDLGLVALSAAQLQGLEDRP